MTSKRPFRPFPILLLLLLSLLTTNVLADEPSCKSSEDIGRVAKTCHIDGSSIPSLNCVCVYEISDNTAGGSNSVIFRWVANQLELKNNDYFMRYGGIADISELEQLIDAIDKRVEKLEQEKSKEEWVLPPSIILDPQTDKGSDSIDLYLPELPDNFKLVIRGRNRTITLDTDQLNYLLDNYSTIYEHRQNHK